MKHTLILLACILVLSVQTYGQKKIICNKTSDEAGYGTTYYFLGEFKLKTIRGKGFYPSKKPVRVIVDVHKYVPQKDEFGQDYGIPYIISDKTKVISCKSDEKGRFRIKGLKDGFYILKIGNGLRDGFGPVYLKVEISKKKGKKKKLKIELRLQI